MPFARKLNIYENERKGQNYDRSEFQYKLFGKSKFDNFVIGMHLPGQTKSLFRGILKIGRWIIKVWLFRIYRNPNISKFSDFLDISSIHGRELTIKRIFEKIGKRATIGITKKLMEKAGDSILET